MKTIHSDAISTHVSDKRKYLKPEEARRLIAVAGKRGRNPERDRMLLMMTFRHGMRASEAVGLLWSHIDLDAGTIFVKRSKSGTSATQTMEPDEIRALRAWKKLAETKQPNSRYIFASERGSQ